MTFKNTASYTYIHTFVHTYTREVTCKCKNTYVHLGSTHTHTVRDAHIHAHTHTPSSAAALYAGKAVYLALTECSVVVVLLHICGGYSWSCIVPLGLVEYGFYGSGILFTRHPVCRLMRGATPFLIAQMSMRGLPRSRGNSHRQRSEEHTAPCPLFGRARHPPNKKLQIPKQCSKVSVLGVRQGNLRAVVVGSRMEILCKIRHRLPLHFSQYIHQ